MNNAAERVEDPLYAAVQAFHTALDVYNSTPGEDNEEERAYLATIDALEQWDQPATSRQGALAALHYVIVEGERCNVQVDVLAMVKAAHDYFEREAQPSCSPA